MTLKYLKDVSSLSLDREKCSGCALCTMVCPRGVLAMAGNRAAIEDLDGCMECGACARNCPSGALQVEAGVGCAAAVINTALGRDSRECCCAPENGGKPGGSCC